jgi:glucokinase
LTSTTALDYEEVKSPGSPGTNGAAVGVDVGGTKLLAVRLDSDGAVIESLKEPIRGEDLVAQVTEVALRVAGGTPASVGIGVPALVDGVGTLLFAPNLKSAVGTRLGESVAERLEGCRLWIGNDATAASWGEYRAGAGARSGITDMLMVALGTGIGGGIVVDGRLYEGVNRMAGEFGHMVVDIDGAPCPCGNHGCWERLASGSALGELARAAVAAGSAPRLVELAGGDAEAVSGEHVTSAAGEGDRAALEVMGRFGRFVAVGIANLVNIFDPQIVVVGGGLVKAGEVLMGPIRAALDGLAMGARVRPEVPVVAALLGEDAGAVGAGMMARG